MRPAAPHSPKEGRKAGAIVPSASSAATAIVARAPTQVWGREDELATLSTAYERCARTGVNSVSTTTTAHTTTSTALTTACVLIDGPPGIGKSAVIEEFHRRVTKGDATNVGAGVRSVLYASGKCDLQSRAPYGALAQVVGALVVSVLVEGPSEVARTKTALASLLGADLDVLTSILPRTQILFGVPKVDITIDAPNAAQRFMTAVVTLVRYFASDATEADANRSPNSSPVMTSSDRTIASSDKRAATSIASTPPPRACVVIHVDDLQWCDEHTVRILDAIMTDARMSHLMLICSYRTHEIPPALSAVLASLGTFAAAQRLSIGGLTVSHVTSIMREMVGEAGLAEDTLALAEQIRQRTGGNPLYIMEVVRFLQQNRSFIAKTTTAAAPTNSSTTTPTNSATIPTSTSSTLLTPSGGAGVGHASLSGFPTSSPMLSHASRSSLNSPPGGVPSTTLRLNTSSSTTSLASTAAAVSAAAAAGTVSGDDLVAALMLQGAGELQELLAARMRTMRPDVITVLSCASMIGSSINMPILRQAADLPLDVIEEALLTAVDAGMLEQLKPGRIDSMGALPTAGSSIKYRFLHDRIREAALSLQPENHATFHLRIAQALLKRLPAGERQGTATASQALFDICDHLNALHMHLANTPPGASSPATLDAASEPPSKPAMLRQSILTKELRQIGAQLNFIAGKASHKMVAFSAALNHIRLSRAHAAELARYTDTAAKGDTSLSAGETLWRYDHTRALELTLEEMAILLQLGDKPAATAVLDEGMRHANTVLERARLLRTRIFANLVKLDNNSDMLAMGREAIATLGHILPKTRDAQDVYTTGIVDKHDLHNKVILARMIDMPQATDEHTPLLSELIMSFMWNVYLVEPDFISSISLLAWQVAIEKGMNEFLTAPMAMYAFVLGGRGQYTLAGAVWDAVSALADKYGYRSQKAAAAGAMCAVVVPYYKPLKNVQEELTKAREGSQETGDYNFVAYSDVHYHTTGIVRGVALDQVMTILPQHLLFARTVKNPLCIGMMESDFRFVAKMTHHNKYADFYSLHGEVALDDDAFGTQFATQYAATSNMVFTAFYHLVYDTGEALKWADKAEPLIADNIAGVVTVFLHAFVQAMALLRRLRAGDTVETAVMEKILIRRSMVEQVATSAPFNFQAWLCLIDAELTRVQKGRQAEVMKLVFEAVTHATRVNMLHTVGLAHEVMARYWREVLPSDVGVNYAASHVEMAAAAYAAYGALPKVALLTEQARALPRGITGTTTTFNRKVGDHMDAVFLLRASQAIASEMRPTRLLEIALPILMEASGAEHACLLGWNDDGTFSVDASASQSTDRRLPPFCRLAPTTRVDSTHLVLPLINLVAGTCKDTIIGDVTQDGYFWNDLYVREHQPRSILCACVRNRQGVVRKILYMENNQYPGAFTPRVLTFVNGLLNQLAISLETARMYANLEDMSRALSGEVERRSSTTTAVAAAAATESQRVLQERQRYLADVVHDLRTPISAVVSLGHLLLQGSLDGEQREHISAITRTGELITRQITSILDISKLDVGKLTLELEPTELRLCVRDCCALTRPGLSEIKSSIDEQVPWIVLSDGFRFRQIFNILLDFTATERVYVSITSAPTGRSNTQASAAKWPAAYNPDMLPWRVVTCSVRDIGTKARSKGDSAEGPKSDELSLMIAKSLLELMGGELTCKEDTPQRQYSFTFACPMLQEAQTVAIGDNTGSLRVLIVEASEVERANIIRHLRFLGHTAETVNSAEGAMTVLANQKFDAAFLSSALLRGSLPLQQLLQLDEKSVEARIHSPVTAARPSPVPSSSSSSPASSLLPSPSTAPPMRCVRMVAVDAMTGEIVPNDVGVGTINDTVTKPVKLADVMSMLRGVQPRSL